MPTGGKEAAFRLMFFKLPDDVTDSADTSLPTNIFEESTESLSQCKQQPPVNHVQYPTQAKEVDNDSYTIRSTASTLTVDSSMPWLDTISDTNLSRRQQAARDTDQE